MKKVKYESMPLEDRQIIENFNNQNVSVNDVRIKNPKSYSVDGWEVVGI